MKLLANEHKNGKFICSIVLFSYCMRRKKKYLKTIAVWKTHGNCQLYVQEKNRIANYVFITCGSGFGSNISKKIWVRILLEVLNATFSN
jgi:hypothetical protein